MLISLGMVLQNIRLSVQYVVLYQNAVFGSLWKPRVLSANTCNAKLCCFALQHGSFLYIFLSMWVCILKLGTYSSIIESGQEATLEVF